MPKLFLIPNFISENSNERPAFDPQIIRHIKLFFVEEPRSARALLRVLIPDFPLSEAVMVELSEHSGSKAIQEYGVMLKDQDAAIISESGCPCVADPGSDLVLYAHELGIDVIPLVGPSSILLSLMASGLNGQNFAFNGYLPKDANERQKKIKSLEQRAAKEGQTQIFMDTPYRNTPVLEQLLEVLEASTLLCIALDISGPQQIIQTRTVQEWRKKNLQLPKKPALFIINKS